jgi:hypothetical protein
LAPGLNHAPLNAEAHSLLLIICFFTILIYIQHLDQDSLDILVSAGEKNDWMSFFVELSHHLLWLPLEYLFIFLLNFTQFDASYWMNNILEDEIIMQKW